MERADRTWLTTPAVTLMAAKFSQDTEFLKMQRRGLFRLSEIRACGCSRRRVTCRGSSYLKGEIRATASYLQLLKASVKPKSHRSNHLTSEHVCGRAGGVPAVSVRSSALGDGLHEDAQLLQAHVGARPHADDADAEAVAVCGTPKHRAGDPHQCVTSDRSHLCLHCLHAGLLVQIPRLQNTKTLIRLICAEFNPIRG